MSRCVDLGGRGLLGTLAQFGVEFRRELSAILGPAECAEVRVQCLWILEAACSGTVCQRHIGTISIGLKDLDQFDTYLGYWPRERCPRQLLAVVGGQFLPRSEWVGRRFPAL